MKNCFCTIITFDYLHYALALNDSLLQYNHEIKLNILVVDSTQSKVPVPGNISFFMPNEVCFDEVGDRILNKYSEQKKDVLRWALKPVFIKYLLNNGFDKVIYCDCDIFFYNDYKFLFNELDQYDVLLSPHWRCSTPFVQDTTDFDRANFQILFTEGLYNGGIIGSCKQGIGAMNWWARACEYICRKEPSFGFFDDQTHLNLLPVIFENIGIIRHKGYNIANWNQVDCKRELYNTNEVKINGIWELVCIHFTNSTISGILNGDDSLLKNYLDVYINCLKKNKPDFDILLRLPELVKEQKKKPTIFRRLRSKLRLRSRLLAIFQK